MDKLTEFLFRHGLVPDNSLLEEYVESFLREMERGLAGEESSLAMLPTYVHPEAVGGNRRDVIVIDAGGTNLRVALARVAPEVGPEVRYFEQYPMPGTTGTLTIAEFFRQLSEYLRPIAHLAEHIAICFSFPAEISPDRDAKILLFDKEVRITGGEGVFLGRGLRDAMIQQGLGDHKVVVINDTVASQLGAMAQKTEKRYGGYMGFILGTGVNSCYAEENARISKEPALCRRAGSTIINMESGGFSGVSQSPVDAAFISETELPRHQQMEKMCSGAYQGGLLLAYLRAAAGEGLFSSAFGERLERVTRLSGRDMDAFCDFPLGQNLMFGLCAGETDTISLCRLTGAFFDRVALLAAVNLTAVLRRLGPAAKNPCRPVCVSAEGTTFYKARLLRPKLDYFMNDYTFRRLGLHWEFVRVENATITGTAMAGLLD